MTIATNIIWPISLTTENVHHHSNHTTPLLPQLLWLLNYQNMTEGVFIASEIASECEKQKRKIEKWERSKKNLKSKNKFDFAFARCERILKGPFTSSDCDVAVTSLPNLIYCFGVVQDGKIKQNEKSWTERNFVSPPCYVVIVSQNKI